MIFTTQTIDKDTRFLRNPMQKKSRGGEEEIHYNLKFTRVTGKRYGMSLCENELWRNWRSLGLESGFFLFFSFSLRLSFFCWRRRSICIATSSWRGFYNRTICTNELVVMGVIRGVGLLGSHVGKLLSFYNRLLLMQGRYTSSTWVM